MEFDVRACRIRNEFRLLLSNRGLTSFQRRYNNTRLNARFPNWHWLRCWGSSPSFLVSLWLFCCMSCCPQQLPGLINLFAVELEFVELLDTAIRKLENFIFRVRNNGSTTESAVRNGQVLSISKSLSKFLFYSLDIRHYTLYKTHLTIHVCYLFIFCILINYICYVNYYCF